MKTLKLNQMEKLNGGNGAVDCTLFAIAIIVPFDMGILDLYFGAACIDFLANGNEWHA